MNHTSVEPQQVAQHSEPQTGRMTGDEGPSNEEMYEALQHLSTAQVYGFLGWMTAEAYRSPDVRNAILRFMESYGLHAGDRKQH